MSHSRSLSGPCAPVGCHVDDEAHWAKMFGYGHTGSRNGGDVVGHVEEGDAMPRDTISSLVSSSSWMQVKDLDFGAPSDAAERKLWFSWETYQCDVKLRETLKQRQSSKGAPSQGSGDGRLNGTTTWDRRDLLMGQARARIKEASGTANSPTNNDSHSTSSGSTNNDDKYLRQQLQEQVNLWREKYERLHHQQASLIATHEQELAVARSSVSDTHQGTQGKIDDLRKECEAQVKKRLSSEEALTASQMKLKEMNREIDLQKQTMRETRLQFSQSLKNTAVIEKERESFKEKYYEAYKEIERAQHGKQKAQEQVQRKERELRQMEAEVHYYKGKIAKVDTSQFNLAATEASGRSPSTSADGEDVHAACKDRLRKAVERGVDKERMTAEFREVAERSQQLEKDLRRDNERLTAENSRLRQELRTVRDASRTADDRLKALKSDHVDQLQEFIDTFNVQFLQSCRIVLEDCEREEDARRRTTYQQEAALRAALVMQRDTALAFLHHQHPTASSPPRALTTPVAKRLTGPTTTVTTGSTSKKGK